MNYRRNRWIIGGSVVILSIVVIAIRSASFNASTGNGVAPEAVAIMAQPEATMQPGLSPNNVKVYPTTTFSVPVEVVGDLNNPWWRVRDCNINAVALMLQPTSNSDTEKWVLAKFPTGNYFPEKTRQGIPFVGVVQVKNRDTLPGSSLVEVYNDNGKIAEGSTRSQDPPETWVHLEDTMLCKNPESTGVQWSNQTARSFSHTITVGGQQIESLFEIRNHRLTEDELRFIIGEARKGRGRIYDGVHFIGHRDEKAWYTVDLDHNLVFVLNDQGFLTGESIPMNNEITVTEKRSARNDSGVSVKLYQRFVLWQSTSGKIFLIEPENQDPLENP